MQCKSTSNGLINATQQHSEHYKKLCIVNIQHFLLTDGKLALLFVGAKIENVINGRSPFFWRSPKILEISKNIGDLQFLGLKILEISNFIGDSPK